MKISDGTLEVLKNYSTINPSICIKPGNVIRTISPIKTVFSSCVIKEDFEKPFAIYDLPKFLGALSVFNDPEIDFKDDYCIISEGNNSLKYTFAEESLIIKAPEKGITLPSEDVKFEMTGDNYNQVIKTIGILNLPEISITGKDGIIYLKGINSKDDTSNAFSIEVGKTDKEFNAIFKADNMRLMSKDYSVIVCFKGITEFRSENIVYYVPSESTSTF